jgi:hypothetical protein
MGESDFGGSNFLSSFFFSLKLGSVLKMAWQEAFLERKYCEIDDTVITKMGGGITKYGSLQRSAQLSSWRLFLFEFLKL